ncbi:unnamed protein product [Arabidopsis thaliana]|uniref:(thale cress) hypothetical protein n=1 Tax=Arabidopsis thaliana TaxID=3702 RepID=A0A7G2F3K2_ARATH|nr:unnamed protein product [Arabidopsis thaliana]
MEGLDSVFLSNQTTHQPVRSVSLPSRIHPLSVKLRTALSRLSIWRRSSSSISVSASFGYETVLVGLVNLTELYGCVHELLESPYVKHTLLHHQEGKLLDESLDGSVLLLDVYEGTREVIVAMREHVTNLKSALRRKGSLEKEAKAYFNLRKKAKKEISKQINALKKMETRDISTNTDQDSAIASTSVLRETIQITVSMFRHLLLFLSTIPPPPSPAIFKTTIGLLSIPFVSPSLSDKSLILIKEMKSLDDVFLGSILDSRKTLFEVETMENEKMRRDVVEDGFRDLEAELDSVSKCKSFFYLNTKPHNKPIRPTRDPIRLLRRWEVSVDRTRPNGKHHSSREFGSMSWKGGRGKPKGYGGDYGKPEPFVIFPEITLPDPKSISTDSQLVVVQSYFTFNKFWMNSPYHLCDGGVSKKEKASLDIERYSDSFEAEDEV